jgi:hypothetical protein
MPKFEVVQIPCTTMHDIPGMLRNLANDIESGELGNVSQVVYVLDAGEGAVDVGLLGTAASMGAEAYLLLACGQKHILKDIV